MPVISDRSARAAARARFAHDLDDESLDDGTVDVDPENPVMTDEQLARLRPAVDIVPKLVAARRARRLGRPTSDAAKISISIRLDPDVVETLRSSGDGWQSRANEMLRQALGLTEEQPKRG